jgi:hypothetical protein
MSEGTLINEIPTNWDGRILSLWDCLYYETSPRIFTCWESSFRNDSSLPVSQSSKLVAMAVLLVAISLGSAVYSMLFPLCSLVSRKIDSALRTPGSSACASRKYSTNLRSPWMRRKTTMLLNANLLSLLSRRSRSLVRCKILCHRCSAVPNWNLEVKLVLEQVSLESTHLLGCYLFGVAFVQIS